MKKLIFDHQTCILKSLFDYLFILSRCGHTRALLYNLFKSLRTQRAIKKIKIKTGHTQDVRRSTE